MTAMTERDAKAAVREYLDMLGKPIGSDHAYTKFYNATHAWANSPDGPDAHQLSLDRLAELLAFKARVKAAIEKALCNLRRQSQCNPQHTVHITCIEEHVAPILSECEPPAPPQPKFAVGQVVVANGKLRRVERADIRPVLGKLFYIMEDERHLWYAEHELRPLTPEEKG